MKSNIIFLWIIFIFCKYARCTREDECPSNRENGYCCIKYYTINCDDCQDGYVGGMNCSSKCYSGYMYYVTRCLKTCYCTDFQICNHVHGCVDIDTTEISVKTTFPSSTEYEHVSTIVTDQTSLSATSNKDTMYLTTAEKQDSGAGGGTILQSLLLFGIPSVLSALLIVLVVWYIKKKVVCIIRWKVQQQDDTTGTVNPCEGYEMIDETLMNVHINQTKQHHPFANGMRQIGDTFPNADDSNDSVLQCDDYLHPYNSLDPEWHCKTHVYNEMEQGERNCYGINFTKPIPENGQYISDKNDIELTFSSDHCADKVVEMVFKASGGEHNNKEADVILKQDQAKDVDNQRPNKYQDTQYVRDKQVAVCVFKADADVINDDAGVNNNDDSANNDYDDVNYDDDYVNNINDGI